MKKAITRIIGGAALAAAATLTGAVPALAATFDASAKIQQVDDQQNHWERYCRSLGPKFGAACTQWQMKPGPCAPGLSIWVCRPA